MTGASTAEAGRLEGAWGARVRGNREQVERHTQIAESTDFYAPVSSTFVVDPRRTGDAVREGLLERVHPDETWLDIGAGAGRYALPLALVAREVIALEPSPAMVAGLREGMAQHGIGNLRILEERWPPSGPPPQADVALIAHVGYDVEGIGPFLDAMERAAPRRVAVLMEQAPASYADPFWPLVHGEERVPLPALGDFLALLRARGASPSVAYLPRPARHWPDEESLAHQLRHQLWIAPGGPADARLLAALRPRLTHDGEGVAMAQEPGRIGIVDWGGGEVVSGRA